jgi:phosphate transport system substrate-binding protein
MAAIVNSDLGSSVKNLTKQQLIDIFTGKIANWKDVGGPDEKILLVTRPDSSGTRALFTKWALDGNQESSGASYLETDNSGELLETVKSNKGAIGYLALSYLVNNKDVTPVSIDGVAPTLENTYSGKYPVWGYEHMYTKGEPNQAVKAFLDYIMSDEYGKNMEAQGYGVSSKMQVTR